MYRLTILIAALLLSVQLHAQQLQASLSHYSTEDGLSSNAISYLVQDDYGYIWIATWNGVSRFDGYNFYNYKTGNGSHIPFLHNRVFDIVFDLQQNAWLRMYDGRIFLIDRRIDKIVNPFEGINGSEEYRTIAPLFLMSNGNMLASIQGIGLFIMRYDNGKTDIQQVTTSGMDVNCMAEGYHDDIWLGTDKGVHRLDIGNLSVERKGMFTEESISALYSNGFNVYAGTRTGNIYLFSYGQEPKQLRRGTGVEILRIFLDSHNIVWFADTRFGASRLKAGTGEEKHFEQRVLVPENDGQGGFFTEHNGILWVRMNHGGYGYYNREKDEVEYFHNNPENPWNLSNTVNATLELPEGVIFESTSRRALEKLEILKNTITRTLLVPDAESSIDNEIRGMFYDKKRKLLLLGNKNNALFVIRSDGSRTKITQDAHGNPIGRTYGISQDSKGYIWLCSKDHGLFKLTPTANDSYSLENFCHHDDDQWSLSSDNAYLAVEDKQGNIWVATYGGGVNVLTRGSGGKMVFVHPKNTMKRYPRNSHMKVRTIAMDKDGKIWAGTTDGILIMSIKDGDVSIDQLKNSDIYPDQILMSNDIVYLARDKHGSMWVGTNSGGLSHTIGKDDNGNWLFESFGSKNGLPSEEIKSITFDQDDNVWFATDHVLCSYNVSKKIFTTFSNLDGVDETICSEGAAITLPDGTILFGTLNGYYTVDRKKLVTDNGSLLKLRITDFFLNDEQVSPQLNNYFDYYVPEAKSVRLPTHSDHFAFRFAAMNYQLQHRINYQYMLEGYDTKWNNADKSRMATYMNVPTGKYRFKVKAFLLESPDKYDMRVIEVIVPPYFLLSSKAIWLYMVVVSILALTLMFWRQNQLKQRRTRNVLKLGPQEMAFSSEEDYDFVKSQLDWMESHYANPALKIEDMVAQSKLSRTAYYNLLKELTGLSPKDFINEFRLKKAMMYLENTDTSVAEVAYKTGFSDPVYFNNLFKAKTGSSPAKYREDGNRGKDSAKDAETTDNYEIIEN